MYYLAFPEDETFGAIVNSFLFRWTRSCIVNPEYESEDMRKAVLYALVSSECTETPFFMILLVWDDTPWNFVAFRGHG